MFYYAWRVVHISIGHFETLYLYSDAFICQKYLILDESGNERVDIRPLVIEVILSCFIIPRE